MFDFYDQTCELFFTKRLRNRPEGAAGSPNCAPTRKLSPVTVVAFLLKPESLVSQPPEPASAYGPVVLTCYSRFFVAPRFLFRLMLLLLGSCHLGGVCELDAAECQQNYAKECHEYVVARPGVEVPTPAAQPDSAPAGRPKQWTGPAIWPAFRGRAAATAPWPWAANPPPPMRRRYLRNAVLQV